MTPWTCPRCNTKEYDVLPPCCHCGWDYDPCDVVELRYDGLYYNISYNPPPSYDAEAADFLEGVRGAEWVASVLSLIILISWMV